MTKKFEIRNSTVEFLTFVAEGEEQGVQVLYKNETIWATQKAMATLFDCSADNIGLHLKNIFDDKELDKNATTGIVNLIVAKNRSGSTGNVQLVWQGPIVRFDSYTKRDD